MSSIVCLVLTAWWSGRASKYQEAWFKAMETRLYKTVQVLKGVKGIKQMGASQAIFDLIQTERSSEVGLAKYFHLQMIAIITLCKPQIISHQVYLLPAHIRRSLLFTHHASRNRPGPTRCPLISAVWSAAGRTHCVRGPDTIPTCVLGHTRRCC